ncbi:DEAD/DEAH box helicase family protein [Lactobacillus sp. PSON]|uniref:DEAD/DEAH box helicase family protein n=1 Tax=Lactobacillus sp. PSON TaxID=3455454 RepID=UPI0040435A0F
MYKLRLYQEELVTKARKSLEKGHKAPLIVSPAGSGKSVIIAEIARSAVEKGGHVLFMVHRKELVEQIAETFINDGIDLTHTTISTVGKIKNRLGKIVKPTLIITDESHHSLAKSYKEIYSYYSDVPRLGFSATPWRLSGKGLHDVYDDIIVGKSVQWLIENHYLAPYRYFTYQLGDKSKLKSNSMGDFTGKSMEEFNNTVIYGDIIKCWRKFAQNGKTIVYASSVEYSKHVAKAFTDSGIPAEHADAKTPAAERKTIMQKFRDGKIKVLCNADLYGEGINVPDCSCVVLLRPTKSLVVYIQQSMRCMRYQPNKTAVIIDQVGNVNRFGLPDKKRDWSLKDRKRINSAGSNDLITCPWCYATFNKHGSKCPICGHTLSDTEEETHKKEQKNNKEAQLHEVTDKDFNLTINYLSLKKPADLDSVEELKEYAKIKGYKSGWVYYQMKNRGWLHKK